MIRTFTALVVTDTTIERTRYKYIIYIIGIFGSDQLYYNLKLNKDQRFINRNHENNILVDYIENNRQITNWILFPLKLEII